MDNSGTRYKTRNGGWGKPCYSSVKEPTTGEIEKDLKGSRKNEERDLDEIMMRIDEVYENTGVGD